MSDKGKCVYCQSAIDESDGGICDDCWEPIAQYLEAGGTPEEYFRAFARELCRLVVEEVTSKAIQEIAKNLPEDNSTDPY